MKNGEKYVGAVKETRCYIGTEISRVRNLKHNLLPHWGAISKHGGSLFSSLSQVNDG